MSKIEACVAVLREVLRKIEVCSVNLTCFSGRGRSIDLLILVSKIESCVALLKGSPEEDQGVFCYLNVLFSKIECYGKQS